MAARLLLLVGVSQGEHTQLVLEGFDQRPCRVHNDGEILPLPIFDGCLPPECTDKVVFLDGDRRVVVDGAVSHRHSMSANFRIARGILTFSVGNPDGPAG